MVATWSTLTPCRASPRDAGRRTPRSASLSRGVLEEILEERVVSSRGQKKPRGVKRKMSGYPLRRPGALSRRKCDWTPHVIGPGH